jgi:hypothetical protein
MGHDMVIIDNKDGDGETFDNLAQPLLNPPEGFLAFFVPDDCKDSIFCCRSLFSGLPDII